MGWFPARDKDNRVPPENLNFPQPPGGSGGKVWLGGPFFIRQRQFGVGVTNDGKYKPKSNGKLLAEHARKYGYVNGKRIDSRRKGAA